MEQLVGTGAQHRWLGAGRISPTPSLGSPSPRLPTCECSFCLSATRIQRGLSESHSTVADRHFRILHVLYADHLCGGGEELRFHFQRVRRHAQLRQLHYRNLAEAEAWPMSAAGPLARRRPARCRGRTVAASLTAAAARSTAACASPQTCGGGGVANVCGSTCTPTTCAAAGKNCGSISNGCGGTLNCGSCASPQTCGGGGVANVCGSTCTPTTCAAAGKNCGSISNGCGGTLSCGSCTSPQTCGGGGVANVCGGGTASADPILVGAGDISICGSANGEPTAKILDGLFANGANSNGVVFTAGDNAYNDELLSEYQSCYNPTWGRHKSRTRPSPGNHERDVTAAGGYFQYFGANAGDPAKALTTATIWASG